MTDGATGHEHPVGWRQWIKDQGSLARDIGYIAIALGSLGGVLWAAGAFLKSWVDANLAWALIATLVLAVFVTVVGGLWLRRRLGRLTADHSALQKQLWTLAQTASQTAIDGDGFGERLAALEAKVKVQGRKIDELCSATIQALMALQEARVVGANVQFQKGRAEAVRQAADRLSPKLQPLSPETLDLLGLGPSPFHDGSPT